MTREELEHLLLSPESSEERIALSNERWKSLVLLYLGKNCLGDMTTREDACLKIAEEQRTTEVQRETSLTSGAVL